ncbi:MAG TPA: CYTH and CHAD domain-containing protein [Xanthobacteraceae bacterium]|nr:CYTH and CHAD domain-containing protein [Xanthobacteraceae bacterium]
MRRKANSTPTETEIKLLVQPGDLTGLRHHPLLRPAFGKSVKSRLNAVYYDDRHRTLRERGLTLRVRQMGKQRIQTIKALNGSDPARRAEWETEIKGARPDLSKAAGTALEPLLEKKVRGPLEPVFETRIARTAFPLHFGRSDIVVALDQGKIDTGRASLPISEVELELTRGKLADLFQLALRLNESVPLKLSYATKSARGYALVEGRTGGGAIANDLHLPARIPAAQGFRLIAHECLRHLVDNFPGVAHGDAEALHQLRVAIRRLRTAISLFRDVVAGEETQAIAAELRWLREVTGPARDLDVFIDEVIAPIRDQHRQDKSINALYQHLRRRRLKSYAEAREALMSMRCRELVLRIATWAEVGQWRANTDALARARQRRPIEAHAAEQLRKLRRRIRKEGRALSGLDDAARHKLRVEVKKLRYATEFFASLFATKRARKRRRAFTGALREFQEALGALNDVAVRKSLSAEIANRVGPRYFDQESGRARIFVAGLVAGHQEAQVADLLGDAKKTYARFRAAKSFWKATPPATARPARAPRAKKPRRQAARRSAPKKST